MISYFWQLIEKEQKRKGDDQAVFVFAQSGF